MSILSVVFAKPDDYPVCARFDAHISPAEFARKCEARRYYLLRDGLTPVGVMRYNLFWDQIPFLTLIYLAEDARGHGFGTQAMDFWEKEMRARGYDMVMTSTQADEDAQHFYRARGYRDCGALFLTTPGYEQPAEIFLEKELSDVLRNG